METTCENCHVQGRELKRCTGCYEVYYCSRECQVGHWRSHRTVCRTRRKGSRGSQDQHSGPKPEATPKPGVSASGTRDAKTPSASASTTSECPHSGSEEGKKVTGRCAYCDIEGVMKFCKRCKVTAYCSKECQVSHWSSHKDWCNSMKRRNLDTDPSQSRRQGASMTSPVDGVRERSSSSSTGFHTFPLFGGAANVSPFDPFCATDEADLSIRWESNPTQWERAKQYAKGQFLFCAIIDDINEIPHEGLFGRFWPGSRRVLVAYISAYHPYRGRHCVFIQDINKNEVYVAFYLDYNNPFPFFTWGDVRPGRFIFILDPFIHYFMDGSVGLRIEEPEEVHFYDA